jgi:predicted PurR-regulated permease PerM
VPLLVGATIVLLRYAADVCVPLVLGVLISYALEPVVAGLVRVRVPRAIGAAVVLLGVVGGVGGLVWAMTDDVASLLADVPAAARRLRASMQAQDGEPSALGKVQEAATEIERSAALATGSQPTERGVAQVELKEKPLNVRGYLWTGSMGLAGVVSQGALLLFLAYFMLCAGDLYRRKLVKLAGSSLSRRRVTLEVLDEIGVQIQRFLFVQLVTCTAVGVASWLAFRALGLEHAGVWGVAAGLFNSIPYFGPLLVTGAVAAAAFVQTGTLGHAVTVGAASIAITSIEGMLLTPWLVGRAARMNEVAVFVGLIFWSWMWGIVGMLLAVPMLAATKAVCDRVEDLRPVGELLGD